MNVKLYEELKIFLSLLMILLTAIVGIYIYVNKYRLDLSNYETIKEEVANSFIEYPYFKNKKIDSSIKNIIQDLSIYEKKVTYDTYVISDEYLNVLFKVGEDEIYYQSYIYKNTADIVSIDDLLKENSLEIFLNKINEQIDIKYPKFISEVLKTSTDKAYEFYENKIIVHFKNEGIEPIPNEALFIVLNYHEIKDILNIPFILDEEYTNENIINLTTDKPTIAITFDDGPTYQRTEEILDLLKENKTNATFFALGQRIKSYPETILRAEAEGNEIGSHSYNHKYLTRIKDDVLDAEINDTNGIYFEITGKNLLLLRPPYGNINEKIINRYNLSYVLWSLDTRDWALKDAQAIKEYVLDNVKDGDIVLFHDSYVTTVEAIRLLLPELYVRGYQVTTVTNLAHLKGQEIKQNQVYRYFK